MDNIYIYIYGLTHMHGHTCPLLMCKFLQGRFIFYCVPKVIRGLLKDTYVHIYGLIPFGHQYKYIAHNAPSKL